MLPLALFGYIAPMTVGDTKFTIMSGDSISSVASASVADRLGDAKASLGRFVCATRAFHRIEPKSISV